MTFSLSSFGQEIIKGSISKKIELDDTPSFFFKVKSDGSMISYTIPSPGRRAMEPGQNKLIDIQTEIITDIPGPYDPVFIGNLNLLIIPTISRTQYEIFSVQELLSSLRNPLAAVKSLKGFYQSAGILEENSQYSSIRVIAERSAKSHSVTDFKFSRMGEIFLNDTEKILCPNTNFKLPMLSKDGKYVGGLDIDTNTSGVWKILDNYECEKVVDLGIKTGKLNFNFDNTKLTYHIYKKIGASDFDTSENYIPHPEITNIANIYVFDILSSSHVQITKNRTSNSLYPDFTKDGTIVFVNHPHKNEKVSFVFLNL